MISKFVGIIKNITFYEKFALVETLNGNYYKLIRYSLTSPSGYSEKAWKDAVKEFINKKEEVSLVTGKNGLYYITTPSKKTKRDIIFVTGKNLEEVNEADIFELLVKNVSD